MGKTDKPNEELYIRWLQFSMFCPITEVFSQPENPTSNLAWKYSERADSIFRFYAHLRMQLFPYIYSAAELRRINRTPIIRKIPGHLYEFTLGPDLLVAPVYEQGATSRKVFLPAGKWINYWTGKIVKGNSEKLVNASLDKVPLFVKQGSIIPMREYASSIEKGNNNTLILQVYPGADGTCELVEDDGSSNDYLKGDVASTLIKLKNKHHGFHLTIHPVTSSFTGMNENRKWILSIHFTKQPKFIKLDNKKINFTYNKKDHTASAETNVRSIHEITEFEVAYK